MFVAKKSIPKYTNDGLLMNSDIVLSWAPWGEPAERLTMNMLGEWVLVTKRIVFSDSGEAIGSRTDKDVIEPDAVLKLLRESLERNASVQR